MHFQLEATAAPAPRKPTRRSVRRDVDQLRLELNLLRREFSGIVPAIAAGVAGGQRDGEGEFIDRLHELVASQVVDRALLMALLESLGDGRPVDAVFRRKVTASIVRMSPEVRARVAAQMRAMGIAVRRATPFPGPSGD